MAKYIDEGGGDYDNSFPETHYCMPPSIILVTLHTIINTTCQKQSKYPEPINFGSQGAIREQANNLGSLKSHSFYINVIKETQTLIKQ